MRRLLFGVSLALGLATAAQATGAGDKSERLYLPLEGVQTAAVVQAPTNDQMAHEYPRAALALSLPGRTTITCTGEIDGHLDDCRIDSESPEGLGFGAAALRLAAYFSVKPATFDGRPVKKQITVPIHFQVPQERPPPAASPIPPPTSPAALILARDVEDLNGDKDQFRASEDRFITHLTAQAASGGDAAAGARIADAYRKGLDDAIADEIDQRARLMAATMTADQLRVTLDYLKTPAGTALRQSLDRINDPQRVGVVWQHANAAAKMHLCDQGGCPGGPDS